MRRSFVQSRRVRIDGSFPVGKIPLRRRPVMSVSWLFMGVSIDVVVSIPLLARQLEQTGVGCFQAAKDTSDTLSFPVSGAAAAVSGVAVTVCLGMILKNTSASAGFFMSR